MSAGKPPSTWSALADARRAAGDAYLPRRRAVVNDEQRALVVDAPVVPNKARR